MDRIGQTGLALPWWAEQAGRMDTVSYAQVRTMLRFAESQGLAGAALRRAAGLPAEGGEDPDQRIPAAAVRALWRELGAQVAEPAFALWIARQAEPAHFGLIGALWQYSATLAEALAVLVRYQRLVADDARWEFRPHPHYCEVEMAVPLGVLAEVGCWPIEMSLAAVVYGARRLTGVELVPQAAGFTYAPPRYAEAYRPLFGAGVRFQARANFLRFAAADGRRAITSAAPQLARLLEGTAQERQAVLPSGQEWSRRVAGVLEALGAAGAGGAEAVARRLGCSVRTLNRRLEEEGTTLRRLTDRLRFATAQRLLRRRELTLEEIACGLGFSELKAFHRAFVRWSGDAPGAYRRRLWQEPAGAAAVLAAGRATPRG